MGSVQRWIIIIIMMRGNVYKSTSGVEKAYIILSFE
jgi:hypothetical protein